MKKIISIIILICLITPSCKKYEEGPAISFRSAMNRVCGQYTLTKYTIDGIDSLQQMQHRFGLDFRFFYNDYSENYDLIIDGPGISNNFISVFSLIDDNKAIWVSGGSIIFTGKGVSNYSDINFTILKLKNKDMHLITTYLHKEYYLELNELE